MEGLLRFFFKLIMVILIIYCAYAIIPNLIGLVVAVVLISFTAGKLLENKY